MTSTPQFIADDRRWNHNIHLHQHILDAVPSDAGRALDVGCGEGILARRLRSVVPSVTGLDLDAPSIELARALGGDITYVVGDLIEGGGLEPASFDVVASVATIHHLDMADALRAMRDLLRPGGVLLVVGLARSRRPADLPYDVLCAVGSRWLKRGRVEWDTPAPKIWPPPVTYRQARAIAERELPGVVYERHPVWRYTLVWRKPGGAGPVS